MNHQNEQYDPPKIMLHLKGVLEEKGHLCVEILKNDKYKFYWCQSDICLGPDDVNKSRCEHCNAFTETCKCEIELELYTCQYCQYKYCEDCANIDCDWCNYEQEPCPKCSMMLEEINQDICLHCFITFMKDDGIYYCLDCEEFFLSSFLDEEDEEHRKHKYETDISKLKEILCEQYPNILKNFSDVVKLK